MKRMKNAAKYSLYILLVVGFYSCSDVRIEQYVSVESVINNTVYVGTQVRTYNWYGLPNSLEYWEQQVVKKEVSDSIKDVEYQKAIPMYLRVKNYY